MAGFEITVTIKPDAALLEALWAVAGVKQKKGEPNPENVTNITVPPRPSVMNPAPAQTAPVSSISAVPIQTMQTAAPVVQQTGYTLEQLSLAAAPLIDAGKMRELMDLMKSFNVQTLQDLPPEQYGAFATGIRAMGAQI